MSDYGVIRTSRQGVSRAFADEVAALAGLTDAEMAYSLGMTARNFHRITPEKPLGTEASERLLLLKNLLLHGLDTFDGQKGVLRHWLRTPLRELDHQTPLSILDTVTGFSLADGVLGRLDHGIPA